MPRKNKEEIVTEKKQIKSSTETKTRSTRTKKGTIRKKPWPKAKPWPKWLNREKILQKIKKYLQLDLSVERSVDAYNSQEYDKAIIENRKPVFLTASTIYRWMQDDDEFASKIRFYQDTPNVLARTNWIQALQRWDFDASIKWLERKEKAEFSTKTEVGVTDKEWKDVITGVSFNIITNGTTNSNLTSPREELE